MDVHGEILAMTMFNDFDSVLFWSNVVLAIAVLVQISLAVWVNRARPAGSVYARYPRKVITSIKLPFTYSWRDIVQSEDMPMFEEYRMRLHVQGLSIVILAQLISVYFFVHLLARYQELVVRCVSAGT